MIAETVSRMASTSNNSLGKSWEAVWIPYHDGVEGDPSIPFPTTTIRKKYPASVAIGLSWDNGRYILDRASFNKWENDGTPAAKKRNVNARFMFNGGNSIPAYSEDTYKKTSWHSNRRNKFGDPNSSPAPNHQKWDI